MTLESFAELVNARPAGRGKQLGFCPAHPDRHRSLQITQGHSGVLLKCWSHNCTPEQIVTALGLPMSALFDTTLTPEQRKQAAHARAARNEQDRQQRAIDREQRDKVYRLEKLRDALGGLLARHPDDVEVSHLFNGVLDKLTYMEMDENAPHDGPSRCKPSPETPAWVADELRKVFVSDSPLIILPNGAITFLELSEWMALQNLKTQNETARSQRAA